MTSSNFDRVAPVYDFLAGLVFGKAIRRSQEAFLSEIPENAEVLIIGGGTGWILEALDEQKKLLRVDYIDSSSGMLAKSKKRILESVQCTFVHGTEENISSEKKYDVIVTNFFLDVFPKEKLAPLMLKLSSHLNPSGTWLCADFRDTGSVRARFLLWIMHRFFGAFANLQSKNLQDFHSFFEQQSFTLEEEALFSQRMIFSRVYRRISER